MLQDVLQGVGAPPTEPAQELETVVAGPGPVGGQVVRHHGQVREQDVETTQLAVDPQIEGKY